jgi:micrococcal nuclease
MIIPTEPVYVYRAEIIRVIDGDTFVANVDLGFETFTHIVVRLHMVNAPELHTPGGEEAKVYLMRFMAEPVILRSYKDQRSFARWVCDVFQNGKSLTDEIINAGHGVAE